MNSVDDARVRKESHLVAPLLQFTIIVLSVGVIDELKITNVLVERGIERGVRVKIGKHSLQGHDKSDTITKRRNKLECKNCFACLINTRDLRIFIRDHPWNASPKLGRDTLPLVSLVESADLNPIRVPVLVPIASQIHKTSRGQFQDILFNVEFRCGS